MKKYIKFLIGLCCVIAVLGLLPFAYRQISLAARSAEIGDRNNTVCTTDRRVFDYAEVLTDAQEEKLEALISKREKQLGLDIVIVTIDENVGSDPYDSSENKTIRFAEDFYEYGKFGWDGHNSAERSGDSTGAGVIYVDNWYDLNGYAESAFLSYRGASGNSVYDKAYNIYLNQGELLELENDVWEYSNTNPYRSYRRMIAHLTSDMTGPNVLEFHIRDAWAIWLPIIITAIFIIVNVTKKMAGKTTDLSTYVQGGFADVKVRRDVFLSKHTTQRHIDTSSSGGGGGGHSGGGGGGGHSGGGGRH